MEGDAGTGQPNPRTSRQHPPRTKRCLGPIIGALDEIAAHNPATLARSNEPALQAAKECGRQRICQAPQP